MKLINISIVLVTLLISSCSTVKYLPYHTSLGSNPYGSYIRVSTFNRSYYNGELISASDKNISILTTVKGNKSLVEIPGDQVKKYYIIYANKSYGRMIPFVLSIMHGFFLILTMPINAAISVNTDFTYTNKTLKYKDLKLFARYPQGIPSHLSIQNIR